MQLAPPSRSLARALSSSGKIRLTHQQGPSTVSPRARRSITQAFGPPHSTHRLRSISRSTTRPDKPVPPRDPSAAPLTIAIAIAIERISAPLRPRRIRDRPARPPARRSAAQAQAQAQADRRTPSRPVRSRGSTRPPPRPRGAEGPDAARARAAHRPARRPAARPAPRHRPPAAAPRFANPPRGGSRLRSVSNRSSRSLRHGRPVLREPEGRWIARGESSHRVASPRPTSRRAPPCRLHVFSSSDRKPSTSRSKASGCSMFTMCPAPGTTTWRAFGSFALITSPARR